MKLLVADRTQEPGLRALAGSPMPGVVRLSFQREPDFFHGLGVCGTFNQAVAAVENDAVIGMGCRSVKPAWVNGHASDIGYLGSLRAPGAHALSRDLWRAYKYLAALHGDGRTPAYLTTIVEDNRRAIQALTGGRAGLPLYNDYGRYWTLAIPVRRNGRDPGPPLRRGDAVGADPVLEFLNRAGRRRQFFPRLRKEHFGTDYLRGLDPHCFHVCERNGAIAGVAAAWDQTSFRQNVVAGYAAWLRMLRPLLNPGLRVAGLPPLPPAGRALRMVNVSFTCVDRDDPAAHVALLRSIAAESRGKGFDYMVAGAHERDPLLPTLRSFPHVPYRSRLYVAAWPDGSDFVNSLDMNLVPHLEPATL